MVSSRDGNDSGSVDGARESSRGLFEEAMALCGTRFLGPDEFRRSLRSRAPDATGASVRALWALVSIAQRQLGVILPSVASKPLSPQPDRYPQPEPRGCRPPVHWAFPTKRLLTKERICLANGVNNPHVATTLRYPEGRHVKLSLLLRDCHAALRDCGCRLSKRRFYDIALGLVQPETPQEVLASNYSRVFDAFANGHLHLDDGDDVSALYEQCVSGISAEALAGIGCHRRIDDHSRRTVSEILRQAHGLGTIMHALAVMLAFLETRPLPIANALVGRVLFGHTLRSNGMDITACLPVLEFVLAWQSGKASDPHGYWPTRTFGSCILEVQGTRNLTGLYEELFAYLADELTWLSRKLDRMSLRRSNLEKLLAADAAHTHRQRDILVEAVLHDDAEFTFGRIEEQYGVAYSTAHADLTSLCEEGFLKALKQGKREFFIAVPNIKQLVHGYLRSLDSAAYLRLFDEHGKLARTRSSPNERPDGSLTHEADAPITRLSSEIDARPYWPQIEPSRRRSILKGTSWNEASPSDHAPLL